jgi:acylphosphatase
MRKRVRYIGRVQGVGFRATARALAQRHPLVGWVRNEPDGSVLLEVQGTGADVDTFLVSLAGAMERYIQSANEAELSDAAGGGVGGVESAFEIRRS